MGCLSKNIVHTYIFLQWSNLNLDLKGIVKLSSHYQWNSSFIVLTLIQTYKSLSP
jgi:hypothetical protein